MRITIETIPHLKQRYNTVGDWTFDENGDLNIKVSEMSNVAYEMSIAIHELTEVMLCTLRGIDQEEVDKFDLNYEGPGEPGDDLEAPYRQEHGIATGIERIFAAEAGIIWQEYENEIEGITQPRGVI